MQQVARAADGRPALGARRRPRDAHAHGAAAAANARDLRAEICQLHARELRVRRHKRAAHRLLERVDRPVADALAAKQLAADADLSRRVRSRSALVSALARLDGECARVERRAVRPICAPHEQLERRLGVLEPEPLRLELLHLPREVARELVRRVEVDAEAARALDDVHPARELADEDAAPVADAGRVDVLVRRRVARDSVYVDAALVCERGLADVRLPLVRCDGGNLVDEARDLRQLVEPFARGAIPPELQDEVGHDRRQVRVADALAVAVDRPLHLRRAGGDRRERVRNGEAAVVVRVDADTALLEAVRDPRDRVGDLLGQRPAVRVAEDEPVGAGVRRRRQHLERVPRARAVAVEEVLRVDCDLTAGALQVRDRVRDHREVLVERRPQHLAHVGVPRLRDDRDGRRAGVDERTEIRVLVGGDGGAAGAAECRHARVPERLLPERREELRVLRVRPRPAALDPVDPERVEAACDIELVLQRQRDPGALAAVAEGRVVDRDGRRHLPLRP